MMGILLKNMRRPSSPSYLQKIKDKRYKYRTKTMISINGNMELVSSNFWDGRIDRGGMIQTH